MTNADEERERIARPDANAVDDWPTGRLLAVAARLVESRWLSVLDGLGLSHAGLIALHMLGTNVVSQRELAARCQVTDQTMGRTVNRLRRAGHVHSEPDPRDARRVLVRATAAGHAAHQHTVEAERNDPALLGAGDDDTFRRHLVRLVKYLERREQPYDDPS